jgi:hypothetical protein
MAPVEKNINPSVGSQLKIGRWMLLVEGKEYRQIHGSITPTNTGGSIPFVLHAKLIVRLILITSIFN